MIAIAEGKVTSIIRQVDGLQEILVEIPGQAESRAVNYPQFCGEVQVGDRVRLNTTAVNLGLGSGGFHLVIAILDRMVTQNLSGSGHIMKMRYTPLQMRVLAVEEEASPHREIMASADDIEGMAVLAATLHSQVAPLASVLGARGLKTAYIMTDGAALPMAFSNTVRQLKTHGLLAGTITIGHAFGGDLEAVNIYSGLLAARHVLQADAVIVAMGPGIVGTGTRWGFTGIEQGQTVNAAAALGGWPVIVPRISFADARERHRGLSHHTLTVLTRVCQVPCLLPLPELEPAQQQVVQAQIRDGIAGYHQVIWCDGTEVLDAVPRDIKLSTMGRSAEQDREFFLACGAAARAAAELVTGQIKFAPPSR